LVAFEGHTAEATEIVDRCTSLRQGLEGLIALELRILLEAREVFRIWLREVRGANGYPHSAARKALRQFSAQLIRLFEKWQAMPDPQLGLSLPLLRDVVFGSLEHVVWTALVQKREDAIDVPSLSRDLAAAYLRAFGLDAEPEILRQDRSAKSKMFRTKKEKAYRRPSTRRRRSTGTRHTKETA
jgi:hypothetical protein